MPVTARPFLIFTSYTAAFLLTEFALYGRFSEIFGSGSVPALYSLAMFMNGCGYLLFPALSRLASGRGVYKALMGAAFAFVLSAAVTEISSAPAAVILSAFISMAAGGFLGGAALYSGAVLLRESGMEGRVFAAATAAATIVQYPIQNFTGTPYIRLAAVVLGTALLLKASAPIPEAPDAAKARTSKMPAAARRGLIAAAVIAILLSHYFGIVDGILMKLNAEGKISVAAWPRLIYIGSVLLAGYAADAGKGRYFNFLTLSVASVIAVYPLFMGRGLPYDLFQSTLWFFNGFYVVCISVPFMRLSVKSGFPQLWAGAGRAIKQFVNCFAVIPTALLLEASGPGWALWCNAAVIIGLTAFCFIRMRRKNIADASESDIDVGTEEDAASALFNERIGAFAERYGLTPRERAVLEHMLVNDETALAIGDALGISERTCQRTITSIYDKTEARTRTAVYKLFHEQL